MNIEEKSNSDYWLDGSLGEISFDTIDLIKLAELRRLIANFSFILTNKNIPVSFLDNSDINMTEGEKIWISAGLKKKEDFDVAVGVCLHESAHILLSDFKLLKQIWQKVPRELYDLAKEKNLDKEQTISLFRDMLNYVEDRYIDNYIYSTAPGYRGYYVKMYEKYFYNKSIDDGLQSDLFRDKDITSYEYRIINLLNKNADFNALPGLKDIFNALDIRNIKRLKTIRRIV